jgi:hypothetical protein
MWATHFCITKQLLLRDMLGQSLYTAILVLSVITLLTSCSTIAVTPVRELSASSYCYEDIGMHSTLYMRFFIAFPLLLTEILVFSIPPESPNPPIVPYLSLSISLLFVIWWLGWLSSLYNTIFFTINNLLNGLVFGEGINHSGHTFRGKRMWWTGLLGVVLNTVVIGVNAVVVRGREGVNSEDAIGRG